MYYYDTNNNVSKNELAEKRGGRGEERRRALGRAESLSKEQNLLALLRSGPVLWKRAIGSNHHEAITIYVMFWGDGTV
jgi:hypothetical protein